MGRPLNKKYFGNRNVGVNGNQTGVNANFQNYADDRIGGEGVAQIIANPIKGVALINSSYPAPALQIPDPTIPGGVRLTAQVIWEIDHIELISGGSNYTDTLPTNVTFTGLGGRVAAVGRMTAVGAGPGFAATTPGINGTSNANWDSPGANRGEWVNTPPTANASYEVCTGINVSLGGDNAQAQVFFRVKSIEVLTPGSGYIGTEAFSWATAGRSANPFPAPPSLVLKTDSGAPGSATNQENAIIINANVGEGNEIGDIIRQVRTRGYKVKTKIGGIGICNLVADDNPDVGEAFIKATDNNGNTYFVTKLTAHKATLVQWIRNGGAPWLYSANHDVAEWTFGATEAPTIDSFGRRLNLGVVLIQNA